MTAVPAIRAEGLTKHFGEHQVLCGVDLTVMPGEVVCIIGPSGSGKSTLLRCLNHLSPPTQGRIWICGEAFGEIEMPGGGTRQMPERRFRLQRSRLGMVFQNFNLWPHRTVVENIMEGPMLVQSLSRQQARDRATALLDRVGLGGKADSYPARLSGGQQQRVAIARALAMEPEILLFDEPTSALDPELVGEVLAVMADLAARHTTMVVVTHELGFAAEAADRMVMMDAGRIIEEGPPRAFFGQPRSARSREFLAKFMNRSAALSAMMPLKDLNGADPHERDVTSVGVPS